MSKENKWLKYLLRKQVVVIRNLYKRGYAIASNGSPHPDIKHLCSVALENTLWKQTSPSVTSDAYSLTNVLQTVGRFIGENDLLPQGIPCTVLLSPLKSDASVVQQQGNPVERSHSTQLMLQHTATNCGIRQLNTCTRAPTSVLLHARTLYCPSQTHE
ncbi:hypothetical protein TNCV_1996541 [Trichonephila clavipes]|uniref:Uncharacterized protein n=1 Tax=Trichonephila clavipes TaxID=2585209 RepID=A0A8X6RPZ8_TRICX|nr:hypothetical protein TNCV_1996541 [Trichonephila clavipes]